MLSMRPKNFTFRRRNQFWYLAPLIVICWIGVHPFDYDESLYMSMANTMVSSGDFFSTIWDGRLMTDKPPPFMWTLAPFSNPGLMQWAPGLARIVSLLASIVLAFVSARVVAEVAPLPTLGTRQNSSQRRFFSLGFWLYFCTILPLFGAGLLLIDPLLCATLAYPFFLLVKSWHQHDGSGPQPIGFWPCLGAALSLSVGASLKGLIALVIPGLACAFQTLAFCSLAPTSFLAAFRAVVFRHGPLFALATLGTAVFYGGLWAAGHEEFVRSFFMDHHIGRGTRAMESHGGSFFYHWPVILLGGGWLSVCCLHFLSRLKGLTPFRLQNSFVLCWFLASPFFFSFMATKLPNYTWPSWMAFPALVLLIAMASRKTEKDSDSSAPSPKAKMLGVIQSGIIPTLMGLIAFAIAVCGVALLAAPFVLRPEVISLFAHLLRPEVSAVSNTAGVFEFSESVLSLLAGVLFLALSREILLVFRFTSHRDMLKRVPLALALHVFAFAAAALGPAKFATRVVVDPLIEAGRFTSRAYPERPVITYGLRSPVFSLWYQGATNPPRQVGLRSPVFKEYALRSPILVMPAWSPWGCDKFSAKMAKQIGYLRVCETTPAAPQREQ